VRNIVVVWLLTGFWHGADWNFLAWGGYFAAWLLLEKFGLERLLSKLPKFVSHIYLLLVVMVGWVLFDGVSFTASGKMLGAMFGADLLGGGAVYNSEALYYLKSYALLLMVGVIGATPLPKMLYRKVQGRGWVKVCEAVLVGVGLVVVSAFLVDGSFNPFIYFRF
jgi:alginate O-acetyltransferase complex protein AlgI